MLWGEPVETRIPAAVHLSKEPGLQTDPPGLDAHGVWMEVQGSEGDSGSCGGQENNVSVGDPVKHHDC